MTEQDLRDMGFSGDWVKAVGAWGTLENIWVKTDSPSTQSRILSAFNFTLGSQTPDIIKLPTLAIVDGFLDEAICNANYLDIYDLTEGLQGVRDFCKSWNGDCWKYSNNDHLRKYIIDLQSESSDAHRQAYLLAWSAIDCQRTPWSIFAATECAVKLFQYSPRLITHLSRGVILKHIPDIAPLAVTVRLLK